MSNAVLQQSRPKFTERVPSKTASPDLRRVIKLYWILGLVAVLLTVSAIYGDRLVAAVDQPIEAFSVTGEFANLEQNALRSALEPWVGKSLLASNLRDIQASVESLPWVHSATVSRNWPDTIQVQVLEQKAIANWGHEAYLNGAGEIFAPESTARLDGRPILSGPNNAAQALRIEMLETVEALNKQLMVYEMSVDQLILNERGSWQLGLTNGLFIELGSEPGGERLARAVKVYEGLAAEARLAVEKIDARYTNGVAVRWKDLAVASGYEYSVNPLQR